MLFQGGEVTFQPGDLSFLLKYAVPVPRAWPRLALRGAIKAPTGDLDEVTGSGEPDFGVGVAADYQVVVDRLMLYGNLNLVYPVGPITAGDLTLNPIFTESFAAHLAVTQRWSAMLHQAVYTSPFHGTNTRLLDGTVVELGFGVNFVYSRSSPRSCSASRTSAASSSRPTSPSCCRCRSGRGRSRPVYRRSARRCRRPCRRSARPCRMRRRPPIAAPPPSP